MVSVWRINFYSDFQQLKYVFVEIEKKGTENQVDIKNDNVNVKSISNTEMTKLDLLNDQIRILDETNQRFIKENQVALENLQKEAKLLKEGS